jgi:hypothetical protein
MIKLEPGRWDKIHQQLSTEYPASVMLIRSRMREVLGFTVREHSEWITTSTKRKDGTSVGYYKTWICLDFYNDAMLSWFQLKYL